MIKINNKQVNSSSEVKPALIDAIMFHSCVTVEYNGKVITLDKEKAYNSYYEVVQHLLMLLTVSKLENIKDEISSQFSVSSDELTLCDVVILDNGCYDVHFNGGSYSACYNVEGMLEEVINN